MGAVISLVFMMFRLMFVVLRYTVVLSIWMVSAMIVLTASLFGGTSRALPRLRL